MVSYVQRAVSILRRIRGRVSRELRSLTSRSSDTQAQFEGTISGGHQTDPNAERVAIFGAVQQLWRRTPDPDFRLEYADATSRDLAVIMCLWNRPQRIDSILRLLDSQSGLDERKIHLILWNNDPRHTSHYLARIENFEAIGALRRVDLIQSGQNVRGIARFIAARGLFKQGYEGPLVTLDDDQDIGRNALSTLLDVYREYGGRRLMAGVWSWRAEDDDYWQRDRAKHGEPANYVGTGGAVIDSEIFGQDELFTTLDERGVYLEDVWLSRFALARGWNLLGVEFDVDFVLDETNQSHGLTFDKLEFWQSLESRLPIPASHVRKFAN